MYDPQNPLTGGGMGTPTMGGMPTMEEIIARKRREQASGVTPLPPEEADTMLSKVAAGGLGALHYIGSTLEKTFGGRAIRSAISGMQGGKFNASELLSPIPFSDFTGLTSEANRVSGEDLLKQAGMLTGEGEKGTFEMRDLAGPALEIALDPATYLTGLGAMTKLGRATKDLGLMPPKLTAKMAGLAAGSPEAAVVAAKMGVPVAEVVGKPLAGLGGLGLPFSHPAAIMGTGPTGQKIAGWLEKAADKALYSKPGVVASRLFGYTAGKGQTAAVQRVNREVVIPSRIKKDAEAMLQHLELGKPIEPHGLLDMAQADKMKLLTEGIEPVVPGTASAAAEQGFVDAVKAAEAARLDEALNIGRPKTALQDRYAKNYLHRERAATLQETPGYAGGARKNMNPAAAADLARQDDLRHFVRGEVGFNEYYKNQALGEMARGIPAKVDPTTFAKMHTGHAAHDIAEAVGVAGGPHAGTTFTFTGPTAQADLNAALARAGVNPAHFAQTLRTETPLEIANRLGHAVTAADITETAAKPALAAQTIRRDYLGMTPTEEWQLASWKSKTPLTAAPPGMAHGRPPRTIKDPVTGVKRTNPDWVKFNELEATWKQAESLVDRLKHADPIHAQKGWDFFGHHPLTDVTLGALGHGRAQAAAEGLQHGLASGVQLQAGLDTVPVVKALQDVGLGHTAYNPATGTSRGGEAYLLDLLKKKDPATFGTKTVADLQDWHVPRTLVEDLLQSSGAAAPPEATNALLRLVDSATNLTKAGQTSLWPGFHTRNLMTGVLQNVVSGARDPRYSKLNPWGYVRPYLDAVALRNNQVVPGAAKIFEAAIPGIDDVAATRLIHENMFIHGARHSPQSTQAMEAIGRTSLERPLPIGLPGTGGEKTLLQVINPAQAAREAAAAGATKKGMANPLNYRGVGDRLETTFLPGRMGQEIGATVDDLNRMSATVAHLRQGVDPAEAALRATQAHYDFGKMTDFERNVMRRLIPFYSWSRANVPYQAKELMTRPGGVSASLVKGLDSLRSSGGFLPENVSEGMAIPIGKEQDGTTRFMTHMGFPVEDAFSFLGTGASPITRTGERIAGMANPLLKMPAELIAGKQFYSGRHLEDLYSPTGNLVEDQLIMNSPISRAVTSYRQATDPRKSFGDFLTNFIGPAKMTDVDVDKARQIAGRDIITGRLKAGNEARSFETMYVPPANLPAMSPEDMQLYRLYKALEVQRMAASRAAKAKAQQQGVR